MSTIAGPPPWPRGPIALCPHGSTVERGCRHCLGPDYYRVRHYDPRPTLSPLRLAALCGLLVLTLLYLGVMVHNVDPPWPAAVQRDLMACRAVATGCQVVHAHGSWTVTR